MVNAKELMSTAEANGLIVEDKAKFFEKIKTSCDAILKDHPGNRCAKYAKEFVSKEENLTGLVDEDLKTFYKCIKTGLDNPDSGLGCYAMKPDDYTKFHGFFDKVIRDYHCDPSGSKKHETDWTVQGSAFDLVKLGLKSDVSMRVRVGRNLKGFNLPGAMSKQERISFEKAMLPALDQLKSKWGGNIYSLTPDFDGEVNPNFISDEMYNELVKAHVMFKDMSADTYLNSAGISNDWPHGRGCWQSEDKMRIIWFGEEDQLRIMCMKKGSNLAEVFCNLEEMLKVVESIDGIDFAKDESYGYVTSCPSNLGTGMRASVHVQVPNLTKDGTDAKAKDVCKPLGLSVRGTGGEHTPIGSDGTIDISPSARLFIKEKDIIANLYKGIQKLMAIENGMIMMPVEPPV